MRDHDSRKQQNEYVPAANAWVRHIVGFLQHNRSDGVNEVYGEESGVSSI